MIQQLQTSIPAPSFRRDKRLLLTSLLIPVLFVFFFFFRWAVEVFRYSMSLRFIYELGTMVGFTEPVANCIKPLVLAALGPSASSLAASRPAA